MGDKFKHTGNSVTATSFQFMNGHNDTMLQYDINGKYKNTDLNLSPGIVTEFNGNSGIVLDGNVSVPITKHLSMFGKSETVVTKNFSNTQIWASPCVVTVPLSKKAFAFAFPQYVGIYDFKNKNWDNNIEASAGVGVNVNDNLSISANATAYYIGEQKLNKDTLSVDVTARWSF